MKGLFDLQRDLTYRLRTIVLEAMLSDLNIGNGLELSVFRNSVNWKGNKRVEQGTASSGSNSIS